VATAGSRQHQEGAATGRALLVFLAGYTQVSSHMRLRHSSTGIGVPV
jgi:hypothetical protein